MSDMTPEDIQDLIHQRQRFQSVINDSYILGWLLNDCNYFSQDPELIKPELIAHCNRLMYRMGIITPYSVDRVAQALLNSAEANDFEEEPPDVD